MTDLELIQELGGDTCRCGRGKAKGHTFCSGCFHKLPRPLQEALYQTPGRGYREAVEDAWLFLKEGSI